MTKVDRIVKLSHPYNNPRCDKCNPKGDRVSTYKIQMIPDGLWVYVCSTHIKDYSL